MQQYNLNRFDLASFVSKNGGNEHGVGYHFKPDFAPGCGGRRGGAIY
jgi:hypothetical protein